MTALPQRGFTLLEALVALVVISVGLLGLLGLQTVAIVNTHVSKAQTLASIATDDMADRIRVNRPNDLEALRKAAHAYSTIQEKGVPAPQKDCTKTICDPEAMAHYDAWTWQQRISNTLANGRGSVRCVSPANTSSDSLCDVYAITVFWQTQDKLGDENSNSNDVSSCSADGHASDDPDLRCYSIEVSP